MTLGGAVNTFFPEGWNGLDAPSDTFYMDSETKQQEFQEGRCALGLEDCDGAVAPAAFLHLTFFGGTKHTHILTIVINTVYHNV